MSADLEPAGTACPVCPCVWRVCPIAGITHGLCAGVTHVADGQIAARA